MLVHTRQVTFTNNNSANVAYGPSQNAVDCSTKPTSSSQVSWSVWEIPLTDKEERITERQIPDIYLVNYLLRGGKTKVSAENRYSSYWKGALNQIASVGATITGNEGEWSPPPTFELWLRQWSRETSRQQRADDERRYPHRREMLTDRGHSAIYRTKHTTFISRTWYSLSHSSPQVLYVTVRVRQGSRTSSMTVALVN